VGCLKTLGDTAPECTHGYGPGIKLTLHLNSSKYAGCWL